MRFFRLTITAFMLITLSSSASALMFGVRFSNVNEPLPPVMNDSQRGDRFGVYVGQNEKNNDFLLGLDYDSYKSERADSSLYTRRIVVDLGYRYRLFSGEKIQGTSVLPFVSLHYYRSFGKVKADDSVLSPQDRAYYKDLLSDQGGWFSAGAEYYFSPLFAIGCEGGVRYSKAKSDAYGYDIKFSEYKTFAAILVTFRM